MRTDAPKLVLPCLVVRFCASSAETGLNSVRGWQLPRGEAISGHAWLVRHRNISFSDLSACTTNSLPWRETTHADVMEACRRCEIRMLADRAIIERLDRLLIYDRRKAGNLGRCLSADVDDLNLKLGDRIEPTAALHDVSKLGNLCSSPGEVVEIVFWRRSLETVVLRRCPL